MSEKQLCTYCGDEIEKTRQGQRECVMCSIAAVENKLKGLLAEYKIDKWVFFDEVTDGN